jgi:hypothetical protein
MTEQQSSDTRERRRDEEPVLPYTWKQVQTAIWLIGLAILFWTGNWWPGILILVAISGLTQAAIAAYVKRQDDAAAARMAQAQSLEAQKRLEAARLDALPSNCPVCGGALDPARVTWSGPTTAVCPYCQSAIKVNVPEAQQP